LALDATEKAASTYISPNAKCPVCEEPVYFYQNEFGSRVYFDELGPPWPKHPCTDNAAYYLGSHTSAPIVEPAIREGHEIETIQSLLGQTHIDLDGAFVAKYKSKPWAPYLVEWCERQGAETLLILRRLTEGPLPRLFLRASGFTRRAPIGSLVHFSRGRLSYFAPRRAKVIEIVVARVRGAKGFVDTLLEISGRGKSAPNEQGQIARA
jgi:hypothetical protein